MAREFIYTYEEMPPSQAYSEGMLTIEGDTENLRAALMPDDVIYATKDGMDLHLKMIYPEKNYDEDIWPLYVHVQGSAWMKQNLFDHVMDLMPVVKAGYIVAIVEYRPTPGHTFPSQVEDAKDAMRYIMAHHEELRVDINRVFFGGESSGGHTAALCWATWKNHLLDTSKEPLCPVRAFIDLYGVVDLEHYLTCPGARIYEEDAKPEDLLLGAAHVAEHPEQARKASVLTYVNENSNDDPLLIMHGDKDRTVPFEQSVLLYEHCKKQKKDVTFYKVKNADHGRSVFYCDAVMEQFVSYLNEH